MVDPYAIVRRLTGHELISPKDARLLTEAVDGLIGEIGSKDARIAELAAENERLRNMLNGYGKLDAELAIAERRIEALSRTGAVKVKRSDILTKIALWADDEGMELSMGQGDDLAGRILSALTTEPAAPEGRQDDKPRAYIAAAEEAYWLLAWTWQSHLTGPGKPFDMSIFAPEARNMMTKAEQDLFDALSEIEP